jgi:cephalosporin hydroxylase
VQLLKIDFDRALVFVDRDSGEECYPLASAEAFREISNAWIRASWDTKYVYSFTWLGRPIIQLPDDMIRIQEVIFDLRPDTIIETGVAHGGSLIFYAGLCKLMGHGRVIGIDIDIRPHNRKAIEQHFLCDYITLLEGSSVDEVIIKRIYETVGQEDRVLILLDSNHSKAHVLTELKAYAPLVSVGSYIVATDGVMGQLQGAPRSADDWGWNNPKEAAREFVSSDPRFIIDPPAPPFNEGLTVDGPTYWPGAWVKRIA